jgi:hypothetical protein
MNTSDIRVRTRVDPYRHRLGHAGGHAEPIRHDLETVGARSIVRTGRRSLVTAIGLLVEVGREYPELQRGLSVVSHHDDRFGHFTAGRYREDYRAHGELGVSLWGSSQSDDTRQRQERCQVPRTDAVWA